MPRDAKQPDDRRAYIITGPTSGIGRATAFELAKHGTLILVGRDRGKLVELQSAIEGKGGRALPIACDLSDISSVRRAAEEIIALRLPIAGLFNNAGIMQMNPTKNALGWDMSFATNHLGPFVFTEALAPSLPDGANVVFAASGVEDPERKPAKAAGFNGGRYISANASAHGEWKPGGAKQPGFDAYATSKQAILAATMAFARENRRLHFIAFEPGFTPNTGLAREGTAGQRFVLTHILPLFAPFVKYWSTPKQAARIATKILTEKSGQTAVYYDEKGRPMQGSELVRDRTFQDRVVAETRALLSTVAA